MAEIREVLRLVDGFSANMNAYLRAAQNASGRTRQLQGNVRRVTAQITGQSAAMRAAAGAVNAQGAAANAATSRNAANANAMRQTANAANAQNAAIQAAVPQSIANAGAMRNSANAAARLTNEQIRQSNVITRLPSGFARLSAVEAQLAAAQRRQTTATVSQTNAQQILINVQTRQGNAFSAASNLLRRQTAAIRENTAAINTGTAALEQQNRIQTRVQIAADVARAEQRRQQQQMDASRNSADSLVSSLRRLAGAYFGLRGIVQVGQLSDELVSTESRLNLINDGLQNTAELQGMIYRAAERSRGSYTAMSSTVSKLGILAKDAFSSTQEIVAFTELLNKNFIIGGAAAQEQTAAMYQLTQAMASGRLQGDEYRSIIENAPLLAQAIEDYMRNVQNAKGTMKDWASAGLLTSDVIKAAMFNAADEVEERFAAMPTTWAQAWQQAKNLTIEVFQPVLNLVGKAAGLVGRNIEIVTGGFYGLAAAVGVYTVAQWAANDAVKAFVLTALKSPLLPLAAAFIAIGAAAGWFINRCGSVGKAVGALAGAVASAGAFIWNTVIGTISSIMQALWSLFVTPVAGIVEWVVNAFTGGFDSIVGAGKNAFGQLLSGLLSFGKTATGIIDTIFGTHTTDKLTEWQKDVSSWGKKETAFDLHARDMDPANHISKYRIEYGVAWNVGKIFGENIAEKMGWSGAETGGFGDYSRFGGAMDGMANNIASIAGDTKAIKNSVDLSDETMKMLVDMAERRYVNNINLTTQSPVIQISGQNTGDSKEDRRRLANMLRDVLLEEISAGSVRSTALVF